LNALLIASFKFLANMTIIINTIQFVFVFFRKKTSFTKIIIEKLPKKKAYPSQDMPH